MEALKIGERIARIPIIQGGMGVGVSRSSLAGAVAKEGGIGVNIMVALKNYKEHVKEAVKAKADVIICGAGLPVSAGSDHCGRTEGGRTPGLFQRAAH